jgi:ParB-like chromosome segregation protein Spo0J
VAEDLAQDEADPRSFQRKTRGLTAVPNRDIWPVLFLYPPPPAAELFPMLPDDELEELAADIRTHGLLMPLLVGRVDGQTVLVDGRNRREACKRAGITPNYTLLTDGEDLPARILSENVYRRHMTKSQRAMVVARIYPEAKRGRGNKDEAIKAAEIAGFDDRRIREARTVLRHAPDLAASVLVGHLSLENAYEEARIRKGRAETYESRFNALKAAASDLANLVAKVTRNLSVRQAAEEADHGPKCRC